ncbi:GDSL-like lipase/acylhydrolase domain protein [Aspergillus terreus]|uniref:GDSL-like lipase/acylhydrolase domain protein n=1 Tax=Aspergillus terreus TaxID=33178 RepID=A0A5M3YV83_ASPTE|nr:hypothetical protein ATETN484_0004022900 [Aspergillus terreus]GFF13119.1 GDSL-like lipase/acylhydrolase domain protein [Aspergillus terreus]
MPGLPLSYGSPGVGWSPRPLQITGSRARVQEQNPQLDLRVIQLVPGSNAEDIRDRWLRPYILPPVGWTEVPKVYHPFTLQYISLVLRAYPRRMLKDGDVPPIIHHAQIHGGHIPRSLANCYTLVRMYEQAVPGSEAMAVTMVEKEMERLAEEDPPQDDCDLLAVFQAYLIYSIMLYFSPIHGTSSVNDKTMITLMDLAFRTAKNGLFCRAEAANARPTWESWIVAAAKRRAVFAMYIFSGVYNADRNLPNFIADELSELYVPGHKVLWEARDRETWEKEYDRQLIEWDDGMLQISELWRSDETGSPDRRRRIERWLGIPGIKLGFTGNNLSINFGPETSENVLVAYRIGGLDWEFSNVTANATYQFVGPWTTALNTTQNSDTKAFEMRVQIGGIFVHKDAQLVKLPEFNKTVEIIGDSLAAGQYATYEGLASWAFNFAAGLGNVEYSITAYPGICLVDQKCYGGTARGMTHQWLQIPDVGARANATYGNRSVPWDPTARRAADLVVINLGTNDSRDPNNIPGGEFYNAYVELVDDIHRVWPAAQIILMGLWGEFEATGNTYVQKPLYVSEIQRVYQHFEGQGFVHYFDTKGILQHNDIAPRDHPTDVGHLKIASHLLQWVKIKLGWELGATGPEVQHDTLYWNNEEAYK